MATGAEHAAACRRIWRASVPVAAALAVAVHPACAGLAVGALVGKLVTPDLDLPGITYCERRIMRWNRLAGWLWRAYWMPYAWRNGHRGRSHRWPLGTLDRNLYLLWLPMATTVVLFGWPAVLFWLAVFAGQSAQDICHIAMDGMLWPATVRRGVTRR